MTSNESNRPNVPSTNPFADALGQLEEHALKVVKNHPEDQWLPMMRNQASHLQLDLDVKDAELLEYLNQARLIAEAPELRQHWYEGGQAVTWSPTEDLVPGLMKVSMFHLLNAEQGVGKSNFCLGLFSGLISGQTRQFLDLELPSSKTWRLFLIGPDMAREGWGPALVAFNLIQNGQLVPEVERFLPAESGATLSPDHIDLYRDWALDCRTEGHKALFVFDSYSSLVDGWKEIEEKSSVYGGPMQKLHKAMAGTGATVIVLHHTPKSSTGSVASSGSGSNRLGRIPDIVLHMESMGADSNRLVISAAKRLTAKSLIVEQDYDAGTWANHGCARAFLRHRELVNKVGSLNGTKAQIFEHFQRIWDTQKRGQTKQHVEALIEKSYQAARNHVNWLHANGLLIRNGDKVETRGTYADLYFPYEAADELRKLKEQAPIKLCETSKKPSETLGSVTENPCNNWAQNSESTKKPYKTGEGEENAENGPKKPHETHETLEALQSPGKPYETPTKPHKTPDVNVYGHAVPRKGLQVEDADGNNGLVVVEVIDEQHLKVQQLGNANSVVRTVRWWLDVFPCGRKAKPGVAL